MVVHGKVLNDLPRFVVILIAEFATGGAVNLALKMKGDTIIKKLNLKPTIDAMMRDFLYPSQWKELSKEMSSKILPCGKSFSVGLDPRTKVRGMSIRLVPTGWCQIKRYHIVLFWELNVVPVAFMTRRFERKNQTLLDMVRSMMNLATLPKSFWGYALDSAARILNMVPTKKVHRTSYEIWHGKAPKLSNKGVWGYAEEHDLGDLNEPPNFNAALSDPESEKWLDAMNMEIQSMKDDQVWCLVDLPPNGRTVGSKWLFKKKTWIAMMIPIPKGYVFVLNGEAVYVSSTEAEYIATAEASRKAVWMRKFID
nr:putative retrotransposon protein [Tanacetum cinerariifolium]